ncbi:MAG: 4Fe-4S binding protein [Betaproteobacteria bacterium]|nr:4Fe-4S binding protein [Betaproteobacteria bacterium]
MEMEQPIFFQPMALRPASRLQRLGDAMQRHRRFILGIQWAVVAFYLALVTVPAFLPLPGTGSNVLNNLTLLAQFMFWGIWWPFVIISTLTLGRVWCGVFCPEGTLTELASRHGLGRPVPRWLKWGGWPFAAFVITTVYGQLVSVYEYPKAVLLVLGGSTVVAVAVGFIYGKSKRVWCRHLCPVSGVFVLLARLAPVHFSVAREQWDIAAMNHPAPVDCAPLIDMRRMKSGAQCHMCGRCSGHRDAVTLAARLPGAEIANLKPVEASAWEARLLVFGIIGTAVGAFQWSSSPWFVAIKTRVAEWLIERDSFALLQDNAPWWLMTHYPEANDVFTWLDGIGVLAYIGAMALVLGGWITLWLRSAGALLPGCNTKQNAHWLAYALIPMGGLGVFLGLSSLTVTLLKAEGLAMSWLPETRGALLVLAALWSLGLGGRMLFALPGTSRVARLAALACLAMAIAGILLPWVFLFYLW